MADSNPIGLKRVRGAPLDCQKVGSNRTRQYEPLRYVVARLGFLKGCGRLGSGVYAWGIVAAIRQQYWTVLLDNKPRVSILVEILVAVIGVYFSCFCSTSRL